MSKSKKGHARATFIQQSRMKTPSEKALIHNVLGVGHRRIKRPFFDLDASDEQALTEELRRRMTKNLQTQG